MAVVAYLEGDAHGEASCHGRQHVVHIVAAYESCDESEWTQRCVDLDDGLPDIVGDLGSKHVCRGTAHAVGYRSHIARQGYDLVCIRICSDSKSQC